MLTTRVLTRSLGLQQDEHNSGVPLKASTGETREDLQRLICSWFLGSLNTNHDEPYDGPVRDMELSALQLIEYALPDLHDWDYPVLLYMDLINHDLYGGSVRGFMHFDPARSSSDCFVIVSLATIYQIFLRFIQRTLEPWSTPSLLITDEQLSHIPNYEGLSLRIVVLMVEWQTFHICTKENQRQYSKLLLDSLLTGRSLTSEEKATLKANGNPVAITSMGLTSYLISELGHISGLPMHPWSAWLVQDVSKHDKHNDLQAQVDEESRQSLRKTIEEISHDL